MKFASVFLFSLTLLSGGAFAVGRNSAPEGHDSPGAPVAPVARGGNQTVSDEFSRLDSNHDGKLSRTELAKHPKAAHMAMADENQDGLLSQEEFEQLQGM